MLRWQMNGERTATLLSSPGPTVLFLSSILSNFMLMTVQFVLVAKEFSLYKIREIILLYTSRITDFRSVGLSLDC